MKKFNLEVIAKVVVSVLILVAAVTVLVDVFTNGSNIL